MSLQGELQTMDMADLLGWAARRARTGTLSVSARSTQKRLVLRAGKLDLTSSNDPRDRLGQFLVRDGFLTEQQLFEALLLQEAEHRLLGALLIERRLLTPEQLAQALRESAEETVYDLFLWSEGHFEFHPAGAEPDRVLPLALDLAPLIDEGTWRRGEWQRMRTTLPSLEVTFRTLTGGGAPLDAGARRLLELAGAGHSLARMSLETRRSPFETAAHLLALCDQGMLEVDRTSRGEGATDAVATIESLLKSAAQRLQEGRFEGALAAYEQVLALDALNQEAKKGLLAVAEGRRRERVNRRVPLDKVPVLLVGSMALTKESFDPLEGFVLSRINGEWTVRSILKLCPLPEEQALDIFSRLIERKVIELQ